MTPTDPSLAHPSAQELLDAVRDHLVSRVIPAITDPRLRFQTLVAAHVLGVAVREASLTPAMGDEVRALRDALGDFPSDDALSAAIDAGAFDAPAAREALHAYLTARASYALQSWNPAFLWRVTSAPSE
ncbi:MAG: DUF6285 domain-containing protein [Polyangiales bacterium]